MMIGLINLTPDSSITRGDRIIQDNKIAKALPPDDHLSPDFDVLFLQHNEYPFQLFLKGEY